MKRMIYSLGIIAIALIVWLTGAAIYLIYSHEKELNRRRTEKARETRLKNLAEGQGNGSMTDLTDQEVAEINLRIKDLDEMTE